MLFGWQVSDAWCMCLTSARSTWSRPKQMARFIWSKHDSRTASRGPEGGGPLHEASSRIQQYPLPDLAGLGGRKAEGAGNCFFLARTLEEVESSIIRIKHYPLWRVHSAGYPLSVDQRERVLIMEAILPLIFWFIYGIVIYFALKLICHLPGKSGDSLSDHFDVALEKLGERFYVWCEKHLPW